MPELPEVETVVLTLANQIKNREIIDVKTFYDKIIKTDLQQFKHQLKNQHFRKFKRRGKYLVFELDSIYLIVHLRMEGKFYYEPKTHPYSKHTHIVFVLDNGYELRYDDVRKFGTMEIYDKTLNLKTFNRLGVEPFSTDFTVEYVQEKLQNCKKPLKTILLDQRFIAGIGNIYANEICFAMKLSPLYPCNKLTNDDYHNLIKATKDILHRAILAGGTTIKSYTSSLGVTGKFQLQVLVHGKENQPCPICKHKIKKIKLQGRGTYFCPICQKKE